ncbi:cytochrome P450 [Fennellomyces sp. T-0311]|nr:cytochrome P450 [Fennellomyces sp. T-0311]
MNAISVERRLRDRVLGIDASAKRVLLVLGVTGTITFAFSKYILYRLYLHPLTKIPGPRVSWIPFIGNMWNIITEEVKQSPHKRWTQEHGGIVRYHGAWNQPRIIVSDPTLLKQILMTQQYDFIKTPTDVKILGRIGGNGLIVAEGDVHRRHRKMLHPAFSLQAIRDLVPVLFVPAVHLCEKWTQEIKEKQTADKAVAIDVSHGISLAALDEIGLFAFGQEFHAIRNDGTHKINRLGAAYHTIFDPNHRSMLQLFGLFFPILQKVPTSQNRLIRKALRTMHEESRRVVQRGIERAQSTSKNENYLLALMIRLSDDESGNGFTPEELRQQCLTFLAAGHETTAAALSWCLWFLAQNQAIQDALRAEITPMFEKIDMNDPIFRGNPFQGGSDTPSYEGINQLHLLNNVCRETLRLMPVVPITSRLATKDTVMNGHVIPKGTYLHLPLIVNHHSKELWGADAEVFRPDRWDQDVAAKVSPYDYCPFLAGGRQCIGYRFALIEIKIILAMLITKFQFFEKPGFVCKKQQHITLRPSPNMILLVRPVETNI